MRKIFLLLLLPALGLGSAEVMGSNSVPKETALPLVSPDTAVKFRKVHLPKDSVAPSPTTMAVKKAAQSLPNTIRSAKV
jgi:membrane-bound lytic murein transglycosylase D